MSGNWTFLTHHAHVMLLLDENQDSKIEELAKTLGVTPRYTVSILQDLTEGGYLSKQKIGRRNQYSINRAGELRHETSKQKSIGQLIDALSALRS
jgi:predicted ArsR family transcriptional regulator